MMPKASKPLPHIIDLIDYDQAVHSEKVYKAITAIRPRARRFIFDEASSRYAGKFIGTCGDLLIANRQFALPPYETTYIQCDADALVRAIGRKNSHDFLKYDDRDIAIGYLIDRNTIYSVSQDSRASSTGLFTYTLNTPAGPGPIFDRPIMENDPWDEWSRLGLLLGTTVEDIAEDEVRLDIARGVHIRYNYSMEHIKQIAKDDYDLRRRYLRMVYSAAGDVRNVWALLLLLNQKRHVATESVPWKATLLKGKRFVYAAHNIVRIHLEPQETVRHAFSPTLHIPRRRHDVMAHFAHYHLGKDCIHEWPLIPEVDEAGVPRWECGRCKGLRVRKKAHERGHGGVGHVTKDYAVTK